MRTIHYRVLLFLALSLSAACEQNELRLLLKVPKAVAVTGTPDSGYYVLTSDNQVYGYKQTSSGPQFTTKFALKDSGGGIDITLVPTGYQGSVLVTQWEQNQYQGFIYHYAADGTILGVWKTRHVPIGIDFDASSQQFYFSTLDSNEVYQAALKGGELRLVCTVPGATQLGPLTVNSKRQTVYVADYQGPLFEVNLATKKATRLKPSFVSPSALLFDDKTGFLFVADRIQRKVYAVDPSSQSSQIVVASAQITSPSGLASGLGSSLVISDEKSGTVLLSQVNPMSQRATPQQRATPPQRRASRSRR